MEGIRIAKGPESIGTGLIGRTWVFPMKRVKGLTSETGKVLHVWAGAGEEETGKTKEDLLFPRKLGYRKERSHKENLMMTPSYH